MLLFLLVTVRLNRDYFTEAQDDHYPSVCPLPVRLIQPYSGCPILAYLMFSSENFQLVGLQYYLTNSNLSVILCNFTTTSDIRLS